MDNISKLDLEIAWTEYVLRLMWGIAPFWVAVQQILTGHQKAYNFLGAVQLYVCPLTVYWCKLCTS